ncbi:uncharacterized protein B0H18DRAFT_1105361 [Fomitopsis serialis]|uniref:uncharacterized protein n=1 Tax=Fomitopsis serialis TaxID=139415 RepID=UPI002008E38F|nr:uncharacterized protein B0H18DRAFT_1105361 [Neoantrodia serialis]KAH9923249.1 hypothetical protein B0H18DRAFT_1105361 [Neoantrodia serialis]
MGNSVSVLSREAPTRSQKIDQQIQEEMKKDLKILVLGTLVRKSRSPRFAIMHSLQGSSTTPTGRTGPAESGKSTIVKQMKIVHQGSYTTEELIAYRTIFHNLFESAHDIVRAKHELGVDEFYLMDNASYFLKRRGARTTSDDEDVLCAREESARCIQEQDSEDTTWVNFPEYTGGPDVNKAVKYILWRFMQKKHGRRSVYPISRRRRVWMTRVISGWWWCGEGDILQNALQI